MSKPRKTTTQPQQTHKTHTTKRTKKHWKIIIMRKRNKQLSYTQHNHKDED